MHMRVRLRLHSLSPAEILRSVDGLKRHTALYFNIRQCDTGECCYVTIDSFNHKCRPMGYIKGSKHALDQTPKRPPSTLVGAVHKAGKSFTGEGEPCSSVL